MKIGIDGNEANVEKKVGISEFAYRLLTEFAKEKDIEFTIYLKDTPRSELPEKTKNWKYKVVKPRKLWTQIGLPFHLYTTHKKPDVFFVPTHYAPRFSPIPTVVSVMDLSYEFFPELFKKSDLYQLQNWTAYSVKKAKRVVTISNSSKNDIMKFYKIPENKVVVIYPGIKEINSKIQVLPMEKLKQKYGISKDFILFVGTLQPRKNIVRLIEAFKDVSVKKDVDLVIVGKKGWLYEEILEAPKKYGVEERVHFIDFVSDEDLPSFYKHAQVFVLPSLYEGFGLPVLEAMKYGCPVATSNTSSLPEAGGDAATYFDPESSEDIARIIEKIIDNKKLREEMIQKGHKQIKKFSWEKSAQETLDVLKGVINE